MRFGVGGVVVIALVCCVSQARAQDEGRKYKNLKVLPADISREQLSAVMRNFTEALGVSCSFCHVHKEGERSDASDDNPVKENARKMMRLVDSLNNVVLPAMFGETPEAKMECRTCHRGSPEPKSLSQELDAARKEGGIDAAVARYRALRRDAADAGQFDLRVQSVSQWAQRVAKENPEDGIRMYQAMLDFHPKSPMLLFNLGRAYESTDLKKAIKYYKKAEKETPKKDREWIKRTIKAAEEKKKQQAK